MFWQRLLNINNYHNKIKYVHDLGHNHNLDNFNMKRVKVQRKQN